MPRVGFTMQLKPGHEQEYRRRHDQIWPELKNLLKKTGISDYSIFLDPSTGLLFGVLHVAEASALDTLAREPVMQRWWGFMKDLMETLPDHSPKTHPLKEVFYLP